MIKISPLYKILVFIEDREGVNYSDFDFVQSKSKRGVFGKMEAMGLVEKSGEKIKLSEKGYSKLNSILDAIHRPTPHWDGFWNIISFSTPENIRKQRDKFRRDIEAAGFRPVIKGLWFSPVIDKSFFIKCVNQNRMNGMAVFIRSNEIYGISEEVIARAWNFDKTRKNFSKYILEVEEFFKKREKTKLEAKELIFCFAQILQDEPNLPIELLPKDWPKYRAKLMYKKLKNFISK